ncbi:flippase-like domain-containing protein [Salipaludibacillus sp. LMS25]|uniref:lysylphosphatidylglycerol synthase transmembrane domain-containing protein n=1 Tax=Salipaludibacillus sp. LMS25 TaxID=2924031 RepID=UPI0020D1B3B7|nr:lysylphosphatidylglycerol synthase transmembrane domain-containing protein [Salipaludibacillus sp. LMS25]UTR16409.1 flippase-like domain-containing protein [Salipaludibacillus sp. LMS25]
MKRLLIIVFIIGICLFLFSSFEWRNWWEALRHVSVPGLLVLVFLQFLSFYLMAFQWKLLLKPHCRITIKELLKLLFICAFIEGITPSAKLGSEAFKGAYFKKHYGVSFTRAMVLITIQKSISFIAFFPLLFLALYMVFTQLKQYVTYVTTSVANSIFIMIMSLAVLTGAGIWLWRVVLKKRLKETVLKELTLGIEIKKVLIQGGLSIVIWLLFPLKGAILAAALSFNLSLLDITAIVVISYGVALIPLTPGGIGTFEVTMVTGMTGLGIPLEVAGTFAVLFRFITFWTGAGAGAIVSICSVNPLQVQRIKRKTG